MFCLYCEDGRKKQRCAIEVYIMHLHGHEHLNIHLQQNGVIKSFMKTEIKHNEQIHMGVYVTVPQSSKSVKFVPLKTPTKRQTIIYFNQGFIESISTKTYTNHQIVNLSHTVDGQNPAPVEVGSLSHYLQGFIHTRIPGGCLGFHPSTVGLYHDQSSSTPRYLQHSAPGEPGWWGTRRCFTVHPLTIFDGF